MLRLALYAMNFDGVIETNELAVIITYAASFAIKNPENDLEHNKNKIKKIIKNSLTLSELEATEVLRTLTKKQKRFFSAFMVLVVSIDGIIAKEEVDFITYINLELDITVISLE